MTISLKHTINATSEVFTPCQFTGKFHEQSARRFNLVRLAETGEFTTEQIADLSTLILLKEGKGDCWTAIQESNLGGVSNSSNWIHCADTLIELAQTMVERV